MALLSGGTDGVQLNRIFYYSQGKASWLARHVSTAPDRNLWNNDSSPFCQNLSEIAWHIISLYNTFSISFWREITVIKWA